MTLGKRRIIAVLTACALLLIVLSALGPGSPSRRDHESPVVTEPPANDWSPSAPPVRGRRARQDLPGARSEPGAPEDAPAAVDAADDPAPELWTVTVLGRDDLPAIGLPLASRDPTGPENAAWGAVWTDAKGHAPLAPWPGSGRWVLRCPLLPDGQVELTERDTVLRLPRLLPVDVHVVDGQTGDVVRGARVTLIAGGGSSVQLPATDTGAVMPASPAHPGGRAQLRFHVDPPPGFACEVPRPYGVDRVVSRFAERLLVTLVLRPETGLRVRVVDHEGEPVDGARVLGVLLAGQSWPDRAAATDALGETRVVGLPYLRGERVRVLVNHGELSAIAGVLLPEPGTSRTVDIKLPRTVVSSSTIGIGGGAGGRFGIGRGGRRTISVGKGRIAVRVFRRDGSVARDTLVVLRGRDKRRTDALGGASFDGLRSGEYELSVEEAGFAPLTRTVTLGDGESLQLRLDEPEGHGVTVLVVDAEGVPVPFARLTVETHTTTPYLVMDRNVQHLRVHTDAQGQRRLRGLPETNVTVTATFGSRTAHGRLDGSSWLTLRLPSVEKP